MIVKVMEILKLTVYFSMMILTRMKILIFSVLIKIREIMVVGRPQL